MNSLFEMPARWAAMDFETAYWGAGSACALGLVDSEGREWYRLMRPYRMRFDIDCVRVNGIYPDDVEGEPTFPFFYDDVASFLEGAVVFAHNAPFDTGVLRSLFQVYHLPPMRFRYGDTVEISRRLWTLPNHKLGTVARHLGFSFRHHEALDDARACAYIVRRAMEETGTESVEEMMKMTGAALKEF